MSTANMCLLSQLTNMKPGHGYEDDSYFIPYNAGNNAETQQKWLADKTIQGNLSVGKHIVSILYSPPAESDSLNAGVQENTEEGNFEQVEVEVLAENMLAVSFSYSEQIPEIKPSLISVQPEKEEVVPDEAIGPLNDSMENNIDSEIASAGGTMESSGGEQISDMDNPIDIVQDETKEKNAVVKNTKKNYAYGITVSAGMMPNGELCARIRFVY